MSRSARWYVARARAMSGRELAWAVSAQRPRGLIAGGGEEMRVVPGAWVALGSLTMKTSLPLPPKISPLPAPLPSAGTRL